MTRQNIIIAISTLLVATILGGGYWYFMKTRTSATAPVGTFPGESGLRPGGTSGEGATPAEEGTSTPVPLGSSSATALPRLYELHKTPVAGAGFFETKDKKGAVLSVAARYIERGLGHIYETPLSTYAESRIVNETRARLSEALWGNNGKSVVIRSLDEQGGGLIKTHVVNIGAPSVSFARGTSTESISNDFLKTEEVYLPDYISFMAVSEDGADKLFYLEGGAGSIATFKDTSVSKIFNSAFSEWLPQFPSQNLITLNTRPSEKVPGHLFFLDPKTRVVTKILTDINGLTSSTNHDGKFVLFSETKNGAPELSLYDVIKKEVHPLYVQTLPEKCVWGTKVPTRAYCAVPQTLPRASYPDYWYQGLVTFSDALWEIDAKTFTARKITDTKTLGAPALDMTNLAISSDDTALIFINKNTMTPWVYSFIERTKESIISSSPTPSLNTAVPASVVTPDMQKLR